MRPDIDDLTRTLAARDDTLVVLILDLGHILLGRDEGCGFLLGNGQIRHADRNTGIGRGDEPEGLHPVQKLNRLMMAHLLVTISDHGPDALLVKKDIDKAHGRADLLVKENTPDGRFNDAAFEGFLGFRRLVIHSTSCLDDSRGDILTPDRYVDAHAHARMKLDQAVMERDDDLAAVGEKLILAPSTRLFLGQVIKAKDDILRRRNDRAAVGRRKKIVRGQQLQAAFRLRFQRERHVDRHLVAVEVSVESRTDQRMQGDRLALDEYRLERLDRKAVKRRRAVEHDGMVLDDLIQDVPHLDVRAFHHALGALDRVHKTAFAQLADNERFEQLERHFLGQPALM